MPTHVGLYNEDTSLNHDTFTIADTNAGGAIIARPNLKGGDTFYFDCASGEDGYGDIYITNVEFGVPNHFSFVRDNDVYRL